MRPFLFRWQRTRRAAPLPGAPAAHAGPARWRVAGDIRIDDRARLVEALRRAGVVADPDVADATLVEAALAAWDVGAPSRLVGDFAFAATDETERRLVLARGTLGVKPLFVAIADSEVICGDSTDAVRTALGGAHRVDERAIAEFLHAGELISPTLTYWEGIARVPPSEQWVIDAHGGVARSRLWDLPTPSTLRLPRESDYVEAFHSVLGDAVADRLRGPAACILLSGGLDSTALAATARRVRPEIQLTALTVVAVPMESPEEVLLAAEVASALGVEHHVVEMTLDDTLRHLDQPGLQTSEPSDDPMLAAGRERAAWLASRAPITLYGEDGDTLLSAPTLATMLRTQHWGDTMRAWREYQHAEGKRPWVGLREIETLRRWKARRAWRSPAWLSRAPESVGGLAQPREAPSHPTRPHAAWSFRQPEWEALHVALDPGVTGSELSFTLPLLDARVIEFAFSLPPVPWCQEKALLRRSFRGILPEAVLARRKTGVPGLDEARVAHWRARGGAERPIPEAMRPWVDEQRWRAALLNGTTADVVEAWRVFEMARWLAQPGGTHDGYR